MSCFIKPYRTLAMKMKMELVALICFMMTVIALIFIRKLSVITHKQQYQIDDLKRELEELKKPLP